ncbi:MAG: chromosomal replication initiator protein DnaA [Chloroflexi bacterium]|nr:chromosomal replication initiator protein DnaA [Chloroflexota bacterium]MDA0244837.1 chromosomal replication initiator protein DnaA [Chloroflexota bacterium]
MSPQNAWKATLGELELQMTKATFNTWLKDARLLASENEQYLIGVRNDYAKDWLENRLQETILRTLVSIIGHPVELRFTVWTDEGTAAQNGQRNGNGHAGANGNGRYNSNGNGNGNGHGSDNSRYAGPDAASIGLREEYVFSTYVAGPSNRLAHAAALSVAEKPGQTYNPLFIYGGVGLGKTHLLHAIGHKCLNSGLTVRYVTSEAFTNDLIQSIRSQRMADFREKYRTPDLLMIDDIQFIAGKESTQEELFHTFNDLHSRGKQVVISSDRPPKAMVTLEERLQSRFEWGLMADIQFPDVETRMAILRTKAETLNIHVPDAIIEIIAHQVRHNIRELEGALNKVVAYAQLTGNPVDRRLTDMALADLMHQQDKVSLSRVFEVVCRHYQVTFEALTSSNRSRTVAFPRQMAMYLARTETDASFPHIGTELGNRDHTTIIHGYEKIAEMVETNPTIRQDMLSIKSALYNQRN